jgi:hypothetical protein
MARPPEPRFFRPPGAWHGRPEGRNRHLRDDPGLFVIGLDGRAEQDFLVRADLAQGDELPGQQLRILRAQLAPLDPPGHPLGQKVVAALRAAQEEGAPHRREAGRLGHGQTIGGNRIGQHHEAPERERERAQHVFQALVRLAFENFENRLSTPG